jgi:carboxyl-terminal processing protease
MAYGPSSMTSRTRLIVLLVTAPVLAFAVVGGYLGRAVANEGTYQHLRVFEDVVQLIVNNYVEDVDVNKVMTGAMRGLAEGLDPDSAYLSPEQVRDVERGVKPPAGDIGLELTRAFYLRAISVRDGSPAARAGLMAGDFVRAIGGKPTREMSVFEGTRLLRGEPGSTVSLTIIRGNAADPHVVELTREAPDWPEIKGRQLPSGVGYLRVAAFGPQAAERMQAEIKTLADGGATRFAIDLRNSATGSLDAGLDAARLFVSKGGTLAIQETHNQPRRPIVAAPGDGRITAPLVLLVDSGTAGPAEVFAAALAGNHRAELVGEPTLGRAAKQKLVKLPDASGLWLSYTWLLTPAGAVIHEKGLSPDLVVEGPDVEFGAPPPSTDPILDRAVERLNSKVAAQAAPRS